MSDDKPMDESRTPSMLVPRWTGAVVASPYGGFVAYGDWLSLHERLRAAESALAAKVEDARRDTELLNYLDGFRAVAITAPHRKGPWVRAAIDAMKGKP